MPRIVGYVFTFVFSVSEHVCIRFFTGKQSVNKGKLDRYFMEFHHEAILLLNIHFLAFIFKVRLLYRYTPLISCYFM